MKTPSKPIIYNGHNCLNDFKQYMLNSNYSSVSVLVDENTLKHCYPILKSYIETHHVISIKSGEENKTIYTCMDVWKKLSEANTDRKALIINLGGGLLCDMGGFIAASYQRGIDFIHIPTTFLSMCDASIGGKTGINLDGLKNQIGYFKNPKAIIIYTGFLKTLPEKYMYSGLAEVIKHSIVGDKRFFNELSEYTDYKKVIDKLIARSIKIKTRIVNLDAFEKGIRKSLNLGHSIGHALESYSLVYQPKNPLSHGEAVAAGIIAESWISFHKKFLTENELNQIITLILRYFPKIPIQKKDSEKIIDLIKKDKKNEHSQKLFTLVDGIGGFRINEVVNKDEILQALEFYMDLEKE
jgi:3-dehydroquinate synthase